MNIINLFNHSFWADEAYISGIAINYILGKISLPELFAALPYQKLYTLLIASSFKLFGASELTARFPSIFFYFFGGVAIFYLAKSLNNNIYSGILSTFLFYFSHLNLSYATQAKPYMLLETLLLLLIIVCINILKKNKNFFLIPLHTTAIAIIVISTYLHSIGLLFFIVYIPILLRPIAKKSFQSSYVHKYGYIYSVATIIFFIVLFFTFPTYSHLFRNGLFKFNHIYQIIRLFLYKYSIITIVSIFGFFWIANRQKAISISIFLYSFTALILATFQQYIFNIRYVLTIFGILFLYFGVFWAKVGEKYDNNLKFSILNLKLSGKAIIPLTVLVLLYATGYKVVRLPQAYYNPNVDKYGDVQIANYKDFFSKLKTRFPQYRKLYVINDMFDVEAWYFGRYSNAYFMKFTDIPHKHHVVDAMVYGSLTDLKKIMVQHPQGLLIMEDWQSFLPDDVKEYAKKNLKLEFRVESLKEAPNDPWPLALYSWGL